MWVLVVMCISVASCGKTFAETYPKEMATIEECQAAGRLVLQYLDEDPSYAFKCVHHD